MKLIRKRSFFSSPTQSDARAFFVQYVTRQDKQAAVKDEELEVGSICEVLQKIHGFAVQL